MDRRDFIQYLGAVGAVSMMPLPSVFAGQSNSTVDWSAGWRSVNQTLFAPLEMQIEGKVPKGLHGSLLRNGPALSGYGNSIAQHWFDGDGMLQRFAIADGKIVHDGKVVQTERFIKEQQAKRRLYNQAGTRHPDPLPARNNDTTNQANIAVLPWQGELLALWEGGSAYRVNAESLETIGRKDWRDDMLHMPFSAHPLPDKGGRIWNFGFAPYAGESGMLFIYAMSATRGIDNIAPVVLPFAGYLHDFAQTEKHLIFLIPPYHFGHEFGDTYVSSFSWQPEMGSRLLVIDKDDLTKQTWFELPAGFVFHFANAWQQHHQIGVNLCWYDDPGLMQSSRQQRIEDKHRKLDQQAHIATVIADLNTGRVRFEKSDTVMEFPSFNETVFSRNSNIIGVGVTERGGIRSDALTVCNPHTGSSSHYHYPAHVIAEEPLIVSARDAGQDYVVQSFLDLQRQQTGLNIFRREAIVDGPVATATMSRRLPLGFHGAYISA